MNATEVKHTPTQSYIKALTKLKDGDRGRLRALAGLPLDETVAGFDLFAGLWWPIRQSKDGRKVPRREVAWLVAKLFGRRPLDNVPHATLARQLSRCKSNKDPTQREQYRRQLEARFDKLLSLPVGQLEPHLEWALGEIQKLSSGAGVDWVRLTDDLSGWHQDNVRQRWVNEYLFSNKETEDAD
jgi:CRISPR type I-E-associated protein CasB/Cse2